MGRTDSNKPKAEDNKASSFLFLSLSLSLSLSLFPIKMIVKLKRTQSKV